MKPKVSDRHISHLVGDPQEGDQGQPYQGPRTRASLRSKKPGPPVRSPTKTLVVRLCPIFGPGFRDPDRWIGQTCLERRLSSETPGQCQNQHADCPSFCRGFLGSTGSRGPNRIVGSLQSRNHPDEAEKSKAYDTAVKCSQHATPPRDFFIREVKRKKVVSVGRGKVDG